MLHKSVEKTIAVFLLIGVPLTTLFISTVFPFDVTDPVNVTKLLIATIFGFALFGVILTYGLPEIWRSSRALFIILILFVLAMINAVANSDVPFNQNIYGVFGRQTGFLAYLSLAMFALAATLLRQKKSFEYLVYGLIFAGGVNVLYCAWVLVIGDFVGWNNPYGKILGLFGNPDFISAFLGMFISGAIAYVFTEKLAWWARIVLVLLSIGAFIEIVKSHAIQGIVVTFAGLTIVGFYLVRGFFKHWILTATYVLFATIAGAFALAGALQIGPLTKYVYKTSVSLRGQYWDAGINMGQARPWTGVGMDSYGNYFRLLRSEYTATTLPGPRVITNAAHNVVIDFFAYGGWPLLLSYLAIMVIGIISILRVTFRRRKYDGIFVALSATWVTYELQSIISINQVGLAIWGWVLVGALVAYEYVTRPAVEGVEKAKGKRSKELIFSPQLVGGVGAVVGAILAFPPLSADASWKHGMVARDVQKVEQALTPSYLNPRDSYRLAVAVQTFEASKLYDKAYAYAKIGIEYNPNYFDAWQTLYFATNATADERALAVKNMQRLDPHNPILDPTNPEYLKF